MHNHRIGIVQQGAPAEYRQIDHPLHCPRKGLHARAFQHERADTGIDLSEFRLSRFFNGTEMQPHQEI